MTTVPRDDMRYIRKRYGVPAKRGMRIRFNGRDATITSADGQYIRVRFDGEQPTYALHPTWHVEYPTNVNDRSTP